MQLRAAVFVAVASVHCWQGFDQALVPEVTYLNCCDTQTHGATGLASCWDGVEYTFEICCTLPPPYWLDRLAANETYAEMQGLLFISYPYLQNIVAVEGAKYGAVSFEDLTQHFPRMHDAELRSDCWRAFVA